MLLKQQDKLRPQCMGVLSVEALKRFSLLSLLSLLLLLLPGFMMWSCYLENVKHL